MDKFGVQLALENIDEARTKWGSAQTEFTRAVNKMMGRLLHEAARNMMSAEDVARYSGMTVKRVRALMREHGLNPRDGRRMLADKAAKTLAENAALMGVDPLAMDLTSPLAYLPMGNEMRDSLQSQAVREGVKELAGTPLHEGVWCEDCEMLEDPDDVSPEHCSSCGCTGVKHISVQVVLA